MKAGGTISHNIVSLYTRFDAEGSRSVVKFGSWDPTGVKAGEHLTMIKTRDTTSWALKPEKLSVGAPKDGEDSDATAAERLLPDAYKVFLEPSLRHVYIPSVEWAWFRDAIKAKWDEALAGSGFGYTCDARACAVKKGCDAVKEAMAKNGRSLTLSFGLTDSAGGVFEVTLDQDDVFVAGDHVIDKYYRGYCLATVFGNSIADSENHIYLGHSLLAKYYVVYDATPMDEFGQDFL